MKRSELINYIQSNYGVVAGSPWIKFPNYMVFRHNSNSKWFALIMDVPSKKIYETENDEIINIINLKPSPELVGSLRLKKNVYPAYHMNKEHWITIRFDSDFPENELKELIDDSYKLTA